jgi:hypothetical protein
MAVRDPPLRRQEDRARVALANWDAVFARGEGGAAVSSTVQTPAADFAQDVLGLPSWIRGRTPSWRPRRRAQRERTLASEAPHAAFDDDDRVDGAGDIDHAGGAARPASDWVRYSRWVDWLLGEQRGVAVRVILALAGRVTQ